VDKESVRPIKKTLDAVSDTHLDDGLNRPHCSNGRHHQSTTNLPGRSGNLDGIKVAWTKLLR
jgi:hypothetical protein